MVTPDRASPEDRGRRYFIIGAGIGFKMIDKADFPFHLKQNFDTFRGDHLPINIFSE
jgi:hypothetical protein